MKRHDGGVRGGHSFAAKNPTRRVCSGCQGTFVGIRPLCSLCDRRAVIALPRRDDDNPEPPRAA